METFGRRGVWYATHKFDSADLRQFARLVEANGYGTLWYPESVGYESMSQAAFLLTQTERLKVGSSIASIYARDAFAARQGQMTLNEISGGRFVLGLGVSHAPMVERLRGHNYGKPLSAMREYLAALQGDGPGLDSENRWTVIAALGPKMLALAAESAAGAIPYNVTPAHTRQARAALGPDKWLAVEQKICLETDHAVALDLARKELHRYMPLPNYRNNWLRQGFTEGDLSEGGSERFLDAMVVNGTEDEIQKVIDDHYAAGADHVAVQPIHADGDWRSLRRTLAAFAPGE